MPFYQHSKTRERIECSQEVFDYLKAGGIISVAKVGSRECELWGFPKESHLPVLVYQGTNNFEPLSEEDQMLEPVVDLSEEPSAFAQLKSDNTDDWDGVDFCLMIKE